MYSFFFLLFGRETLLREYQATLEANQTRHLQQETFFDQREQQIANEFGRLETARASLEERERNLFEQENRLTQTGNWQTGNLVTGINQQPLRMQFEPQQHFRQRPARQAQNRLVGYLPSTGNPLYEGPQGGRFCFTGNGNRRYVPRETVAYPFMQ